MEGAHTSGTVNPTSYSYRKGKESVWGGGSGGGGWGGGGWGEGVGGRGGESERELRTSLAKV